MDETTIMHRGDLNNNGEGMSGRARPFKKTNMKKKFS